MEESSKKDLADLKKIERLMEISKSLYGIHKELEGFSGNTTTVRQDIIKVCGGLDRIRSQILEGGEVETLPSSDS